MATKRLNDSPKNGVPIPGIFLTIQCIKWGNPAGLQVAERQAAKVVSTGFYRSLSLTFRVNGL